jgi:hypothetical protein
MVLMVLSIDVAVVDMVVYDSVPTPDQEALDIFVDKANTVKHLVAVQVEVVLLVVLDTVPYFD